MGGKTSPRRRLEDEEGEHDDVKNNPNLAATLSDSGNIGDDSFLTLEEKARKALECPCVADLVNGPCGEQFKGAFGCFIKSQTPEKGSDCIEPFTTMQRCMTFNSDKFSSRVPTEEEKEEGKDEEEVEEEEPDFEPPIVPKNAIKFPNYLKELTENTKDPGKS